MKLNTLIAKLLVLQEQGYGEQEILICNNDDSLGDDGDAIIDSAAIVVGNTDDEAPDYTDIEIITY